MKNNAAILCIGTELVQGSISDKHIQYLGQLLNSYGVSVEEALLLPDSPYVIEKIQLLKNRYSLVILVGGLGPTSDDLTRQFISRALNISLVYNSESFQRLIARYGDNIADSNKQQAYFPDGAKVLQNYNGSADAFVLEHESTHYFVFPGPPREMVPLVEEHLIPFVQSLSESKSYEKKFQTLLVPESSLESYLQSLNNDGLSWGTRFADFSIYVTLRHQNEHQLDSIYTRICEELKPHIIDSWESFPKILEDLLSSKNLTLSAAESCTGGMISQLITEVPGSSNIFLGGIVSYSNNAKEDILHVSKKYLEAYGAVSQEVVSEMLNGALDAFQSDFSIAVSGIAGPGGGSIEKPVGTVYIGVKQKQKKAMVERFCFRGNRVVIQRKSAVMALLMLYLLVRDESMLDSLRNSRYNL